MTELAEINDDAVVPMAGADPMVQMIERVAMNPDLPIERMTALMDMRERQLDKEAEQAFNQAFAQAMAKMPDVPRSGENKHLKTKYSTLDDLIRTARPALSEFGLSLNWQTTNEEGGIHVRAIVRHALGHSISTALSGPRDSGKQMNALQGAGSTETYLKRYTGFGLLGLSSGDEVDNDGQSSGQTLKLISQDQWHELREMLEQTNITEEIVCTAEKIEVLAELPANRFDAVRKNLKADIARAKEVSE